MVEVTRRLLHFTYLGGRFHPTNRSVLQRFYPHMLAGFSPRSDLHLHLALYHLATTGVPTPMLPPTAGEKRRSKLLRHCIRRAMPVDPPQPTIPLIDISDTVNITCATDQYNPAFLFQVLGTIKAYRARLHSVEATRDSLAKQVSEQKRIVAELRSQSCNISSSYDAPSTSSKRQKTNNSSASVSASTAP